MDGTKKLLSVTGLKKYFPVSKTSLFRRERHYIHANEDISLDIYENETLSIVGEAGSGKSTLGRLISQLLPQTGGSVMYYGSTVDELAPLYVAKTLQNLPKYREQYKKASVEAENLAKKAEKLSKKGKNIDSIQRQLELARCEEETCLNKIVKIMGGFFAEDAGGRGRTFLMRRYEELVRRREAKIRYESAQKDYDALTAAEAAGKRLDAARKKLDTAQRQLDLCNTAVTLLGIRLDTLREEYITDPQFAKYEAMRDEGVDLSRLGKDERPLIARELQLIASDAVSRLDARKTVSQVASEELLRCKVFKKGSDELRSRVAESVKLCGLPEELLKSSVQQLTDEQTHRLALARALAVQPKLVVLDQCFSLLDKTARAQIQGLLKELREQLGLSYLYLSDDPAEVQNISDRVGILHQGSLVELGDRDAVFNDPHHPYTVALLSGAAGK